MNLPKKIPNSSFLVLHPEYPPLSDEEYRMWQEMIHDKIGMVFEGNKKAFLQRRLWKRMQQLSIPSYHTYYQYLRNERRHPREWQELIELLINPQSSFFRHLPSYHALIHNVFPELIEKRFTNAPPSVIINNEKKRMNKSSSTSPISMWSVGCSKGQEAYSLAMSLSHTIQDNPDIPYKIIGTDISLNVLEQAQKGEYSYMEIRDIPDAFRDKYMTLMNSSSPSSAQFCKEKEITDERIYPPLHPYKLRYRITDAIRSHVTYIHNNMMKLNPDLIPEDFFDIIFCQNVLIYFNIQDRAKVIASLLSYLQPDGYIFFCPGETVGITIGSGAVPVRFKDSLVYKRNKEPIHVQVVRG